MLLDSTLAHAYTSLIPLIGPAIIIIITSLCQLTDSLAPNRSTLFQDKIARGSSRGNGQCGEVSESGCTVHSSSAYPNEYAYLAPPKLKECSSNPTQVDRVAAAYDKWIHLDQEDTSHRPGEDEDADKNKRVH